jgi:hypothetical protein
MISTIYEGVRESASIGSKLGKPFDRPSRCIRPEPPERFGRDRPQRVERRYRFGERLSARQSGVSTVGKRPKEA